jgi:uncharacterized protein (TIGR02611 family)
MREQSPERPESAAGPSGAVAPKPDSPSRISAIIAAIRAHPTGSVAFRTTIAILGGLVVVVGLILVPLPGPGWLIVLFGVSIWAVEFVWARRVLQYGRRLLGWWMAWVALRPWPVKLLIGAAGLVFIGLVSWLTLHLTFGL